HLFPVRNDLPTVMLPVRLSVHKTLNGPDGLTRLSADQALWYKPSGASVPSDHHLKGPASSLYSPLHHFHQEPGTFRTDFQHFQVHPSRWVTSTFLINCFIFFSSLPEI